MVNNQGFRDCITQLDDDNLAQEICKKILILIKYKSADGLEENLKLGMLNYFKIRDIFEKYPNFMFGFLQETEEKYLENFFWLNTVVKEFFGSGPIISDLKNPSTNVIKNIMSLINEISKDNTIKFSELDWSNLRTLFLESDVNLTTEKVKLIISNQFPLKLLSSSNIFSFIDAWKIFEKFKNSNILLIFGKIASNNDLINDKYFKNLMLSPEITDENIGDVLENFDQIKKFQKIFYKKGEFDLSCYQHFSSIKKQDLNWSYTPLFFKLDIKDESTISDFIDTFKESDLNELEGILKNEVILEFIQNSDNGIKIQNLKSILDLKLDPSFFKKSLNTKLLNNILESDHPSKFFILKKFMQHTKADSNETNSMITFFLKEKEISKEYINVFLDSEIEPQPDSKILENLKTCKIFENKHLKILSLNQKIYFQYGTVTSDSTSFNIGVELFELSNAITDYHLQENDINELFSSSKLLKPKGKSHKPEKLSEKPEELPKVSLFQNTSNDDLVVVDLLKKGFSPDVINFFRKDSLLNLGSLLDLYKKNISPKNINNLFKIPNISKTNLCDYILELAKYNVPIDSFLKEFSENVDIEQILSKIISFLNKFSVEDEKKVWIRFFSKTQKSEFKKTLEKIDFFSKGVFFDVASKVIKMSLLDKEKTNWISKVSINYCANSDNVINFLFKFAENKEGKDILEKMYNADYGFFRDIIFSVAQGLKIETLSRRKDFFFPSNEDDLFSTKKAIRDLFLGKVVFLKKEALESLSKTIKNENISSMPFDDICNKLIQSFHEKKDKIGDIQSTLRNFEEPRDFSWLTPINGDVYRSISPKSFFSRLFS